MSNNQEIPEWLKTVIKEIIEANQKDEVTQTMMKAIKDDPEGTVELPYPELTMFLTYVMVAEHLKGTAPPLGGIRHWVDNFLVERVLPKSQPIFRFMMLRGWKRSEYMAKDIERATGGGQIASVDAISEYHDLVAELLFGDEVRVDMDESTRKALALSLMSMCFVLGHTSALNFANVFRGLKKNVEKLKADPTGKSYGRLSYEIGELVKTEGPEIGGFDSFFNFEIMDDGGDVWKGIGDIWTES